MILLPLLLALPPLGLRRPAPLARRCAPQVALVPRNRVACYGCGAELQADVAGSPGYMEPERYEMKRKRRQLRESLCDRCRRLSSGEILPAVVEGRLKRPSGAAVGEEGRGITTPEALRGVLLPLRERPALIALLVDLTDVAGTLLPRVRELVGGNPILLIGTKLDLLPRGTEPERVADWLSGAARKIGGVVDVHLVSSKSGDGLQAAARALLAERRGRDLFLLGAANVGKSAFLQSLLPLVSPTTPRHLPLSASTPGTTLSLLPIDCFSGGSQLYDTPGVHLHHRMSARLLPAELAMTMPRGRMRPYTPREAAAEGASFFWGGLARIDVVSAPPALRLTFCTGGSRLRLHECPTAEAAEAHAARAGIEWTPPQDAASAAELGELQLVRTARLRLTPCEQAADLAISGLGWVSVGCLPTLQQGALEATLAVWVPRGVEVFVRPPMPVGGLPTVGSEA